MDGVYRIFTKTLGPTGHNRRLIGRVWIHDGQVQHLEDHSGRMQSLFPAGPITHRTQQRLQTLKYSSSLEIVKESDIDEGHHPRDAADLDIGPVEPDGIYTVVGDGLPAPQVVEVWNDSIVVAGQTLDEKAKEEFLEKVRNGHLVLTPAE